MPKRPNSDPPRSEPKRPRPAAVPAPAPATIEARLQARAESAAPSGIEARLAVAASEALQAEVAKLETQPWRVPRLKAARLELAAARETAAAFSSGAEQRSRDESRKRYATQSRYTAAHSGAPPPAVAGHSETVLPYTSTGAALAAAATAALADVPVAVMERPAEECDACHVQLRQLGDDALLVCPRCNAARPYTMYGTGGGSRSGGGDGDDHGAGGSAPPPAKTRLAEFLDHLQGNERVRPPPELLVEAARALCGSTNCPPELRALVGAARIVAAERAARGRFTSVSDAHARLGAALAAAGVDLEAALRCVTSDVIVAAARGLPAAGEAPPPPGKVRKGAPPTRAALLKRILDHGPKAAAALSGYAPRRLPRDLEAHMKRLFAESARVAADAGTKPYAGGYAAFVRGALVLLGADEFLANVPVPPIGPEPMTRREARRKELCEALHWEYAPLQATPPPLMLEPLPSH